MNSILTKTVKIKSETDRLILKTIYDGNPLSRADIVRQTRLTAPTVSATVSRLIKAGLLKESDPVTQGRGKPATQICLIDEAFLVIGVDISNREFQGSIFDIRGQSLHIAKIMVDYDDPDSIFPSLLQLIDGLIAKVDELERPLLGIGIGTPGLLNINDGSVQIAINLGWFEFPLKAKIASKYNVPVYVFNDSQAAALGQYTFDNKDKRQNMVVIKVGRGISAGIILDGEIYSGSHFGASEIGHLKIVEDSTLCQCGHYGCLEAVASSTALVKQTKALGMISENPFNSEEQITTEDVITAFHEGQEGIVEIVENAGRYIGRAIASFVSILNIPNIVIAGSLSRLGPQFLNSIRIELEMRALENLVVKTDLSLSSLGQEIVMQGAASIILHQELGVI